MVAIEPLPFVWANSQVPQSEELLEPEANSEPDVAPPVKSPPKSAPTIPCEAVKRTSNSKLTQLASHVTQTATLIEQPGYGVATVFSSLASTFLAYLNQAPFPQIQPLARQARVPIMMYHDILPQKQVFFDVTPDQLTQHFELIRQKGLTPISMDQLVTHLRTGLPLPKKPILLTFDDGYTGHYHYVYPLLKRYNYPAVFSIYTAKVGKRMGRSSLTWEQLREMAKDPLVTIASHSVSHKVMEGLSIKDLRNETQESKRILESQLGVPIRYFTYPEGKYDKNATQAVQNAGYLAALTMNDAEDRLAGQSIDLLTLDRIGQSRLAEMVDMAWGGPPLPSWKLGFDFTSTIQRLDVTINQVPFVLISGGKPTTIHADRRAQVWDMIQGTPAIAAVDGTFFSMKTLNSNEMLGPVLSIQQEFIPGKPGEIALLNKRPLVLINDTSVKFIPFDALRHNSLEGIQAEMPDVTDAFVAAGWLVENGQPQPVERFGRLYSVNETRHRAFWGINQQGQPMIGVSAEPIGSVDLGISLTKVGFRDAVMLDSGASTSLTYQGDSLVGYTPRPVPHAVALIPPPGSEIASRCNVVAMDSSS